MREIRYRGKRLDNGEWVEGCFGQHTSLDAFIIVRPYPAMSGGWDALGFYEVYPETVGQYTGLRDRNGNRIFEGDILRNIYWDGGLSDYTCEMKFGEFNCSCCDGVYGWHLKDGDIREFDTNTVLGEMPPYVIAGNIHDNPELLGGNEDGTN